MGDVRRRRTRPRCWPTRRRSGRRTPRPATCPNALRNLRLAWRVLRSERPDVVVSDGAGVAVPFFVVAKLLGISTVYLEVVDRIDTRTLTGQARLSDRRPVLRAVGGAGARCTPAPSRSARSCRSAGTMSRTKPHPLILVLVGTDHHPFDRLVRWADRWAGAHEARVVIQHGTARRAGARRGRRAAAGRRARGAAARRPPRSCATEGRARSPAARAAGIRPIVVARDPVPRRARG